MELSEDLKRRIHEEEQQRLAEEQYRTQVRQDLRSQTLATNPSAEPPKPKRGNSTKVILLLTVAAAIVAIAWMGQYSIRRASEPYAPSVVESKHTEKIGAGQFVVKAGKVFYYRIPTKNMRNIHITGHFLALGGRGNDIDVVLAGEKEFGQWMGGQQAKVYYQSGRATSGDIDVKLPALNATYYMAFDNRFSVLSAKTINADLSLFYSTIVLK
jgi:hypothetical protein